MCSGSHGDVAFISLCSSCASEMPLCWWERGIPSFRSIWQILWACIMTSTAHCNLEFGYYLAHYRCAWCTGPLCVSIRCLLRSACYAYFTTCLAANMHFYFFWDLLWVGRWGWWGGAAWTGRDRFAAWFIGRGLVNSVRSCYTLCQSVGVAILMGHCPGSAILKWEPWDLIPHCHWGCHLGWTSKIPVRDSNPEPFRSWARIITTTPSGQIGEEERILLLFSVSHCAHEARWCAVVRYFLFERGWTTSSKRIAVVFIALTIFELFIYVVLFRWIVIICGFSVKNKFLVHDIKYV